jgi:TetR/AcrR family transcriptional regulator, cholesterol catabolism regulator
MENFYIKIISTMEESKREILEKCLELYFRYGIRNMSNKRLVTTLGISTKTLYRLFSDKEELLYLALEMFYSQQYEAFNDLPENISAVELLYTLWKRGYEREFEVDRLFYRDLNHYYPEVEERIESENSLRFGAKFIQIIKRGIEEGDFREELNPHVVIRSFTTLYTSIARKGDFDNLDLQSAEIFLSSLSPFFRGICTQLGLEKLEKIIPKEI